MAQTLSLPNYLSSNLVQQTRLDGTVTPAGSAALTVENNNGFTDGDYFVVGNLGGEVTELLIVGSVTAATTITPTASTALDHSGDDYVTKLFGSQLKVYRAPNVNGLAPDDDTFSPLGSPVDLDVDQAFTGYTDPDGGSDWWYKFTYFNSTTSAETNLSDSTAVRGGGVGDYTSVEAIREEAGLQNAPYVTDKLIDKKRQAAQREIDSTLVDSYTVPFTTPINAFIADICTRLAAGFLLLEQFGQVQRQDGTAAQAKVDQARADLKSIALGDVKLTDTTGISTALPDSSGAANSWPNQQTVVSPRSEGGSPRSFRMGSLEGYHSRDF